MATVAPILSFTAEEAWQEIPEALRGEERSVFDSAFGTPTRAQEGELGLWETLRDLRSRVAASPIRDFEARVDVSAPAANYDALAALGDNLRDALVVSQLELRKSDADDIGLAVFPAYGAKCARCWKFRELGTDPEHPSICADCAAVVNAL